MVATGGALRRTGFKGYVEVSTVNPDCPINKQNEHKKRMAENAILRGNVADSNAQTRVSEDKI